MSIINTINNKSSIIYCNKRCTVQTVCIIYQKKLKPDGMYKNETICLNFESIRDLRLSIEFIVVVYYYFSNL